MQGRWADWVIMAAGVAPAVGWAWHGMIGPGMAAMLMLGMGIVLAACMAITRPGLVAAEVCVLLLAVLLVLTPTYAGFADQAAAAWTAWAAGAVAGLLSLLCLPLSYREYRRVLAYRSKQNA
ncbi:hypothetical protein CLV63_10890 [Murinocardiopsis flavida]|uniref:SPW repeat-containing protein n=1 Tax=Murinocardiopsis flavida TaxID=645275 RepID=A0A2P8DJG6_9ACTN|nr:hypothetical protein [Murinocardiopsis flavida]PSK97372.1 hypothetical protein CLV63_10890 [Murinocardiopsis flavida]